MKRLRVDESRCTGCESCVLTCSFEHGDRFGLHLSRIRVLRNEEQADFRPRVCIQCDEHPCIEACPARSVQIGAFELEGCVHYRLRPQSPCADRCLARLACPYFPEHRYTWPQIRYHYRHSLTTLRSSYYR